MEGLDNTSKPPIQQVDDAEESIGTGDLYDYIQRRFLDLEETSMSSEHANDFMAILEGYRKQLA